MTHAHRYANAGINIFKFNQLACCHAILAQVFFPTTISKIPKPSLQHALPWKPRLITNPKKLASRAWVAWLSTSLSLRSVRLLEYLL